MQKVKHLEYEHMNNCDRVVNEANKIQAEENKHHKKNKKDMLIEKTKEDDDYTNNEASNRAEIETLEKDLDENFKETQNSLEGQRTLLIQTYETKMVMLRDELELRMKVEIHEIEERKNKHINDLMDAHQNAFKEMKNYFNDITRQNLALIRMHKDKLIEIRK